MFWVDIMLFSLIKKLILLYCDAYVGIAYIDVPKVPRQTYLQWILYRGRNGTFCLGTVQGRN